MSSKPEPGSLGNRLVGCLWLLLLCVEFLEFLVMAFLVF